MALAELRVVLPQDQRMVGKDRRGKSERPVEEDLRGGVGEMVLPADHVADLHGVVVGDDGEVVGGDAVGADDDEIADRLALKGHRPADEVLEGDRSRLHAETPDRLTAPPRRAASCWASESSRHFPR